MIKTLKRHLAVKRLNRIIKPDPDYAKRRAAQLPEPRRSNFLRNVGMLDAS